MSSDGAPDEPRTTRPQRRARGSAARRAGPYRIEEELGRGGMGVVYRAFDERLHRAVALKALPAELAGDAQQLMRLEREARALAKVSHPNVAVIHGMESSDEGLFLVLELIEGETLSRRLSAGPLAVDEALALCGQVAAGLGAVHAKELVHRDLKPSNVIVTPDGTAKLLDFGLAKRSVAPARGEVTRHEEIIGTPGWMSPEQLRGETLDARSDAWAWGCLLFECLAGAPAFTGESWSECSAAALTGEPAWDRLPSELSEPVRELLRACLSKDPAGRPGSMDEVRRTLVGGAGATPESAPPRGALPPERDEFVGRSTELRKLGELVRVSRLVSVLGIGGTGKTRLVQRHARCDAGQYPGGAWFCDLSEARSVEGIAHAVAAALDVPLAQGDPVAQLGHAIAGRGSCLVVLDNFEQVARHAEATLGRWLERCEQARFVVTTREVLGLPEETAFALPPLEPADAVELFRARARRRGREPEPGDEECIGQLVELLDRLPLAVELAAARTSVLDPGQLLERMSDRFRLLAAGGERQDRQATLRATLDWSWELLGPWEQAALAQASVFEGGFTLEAAESVLDLSAWPDAPWPMDVVQSLVEKSLVQRTPEGRFDLLASVQEYARQKLKEGDEVTGRAALERHAAHFARLGTDAALDALTVRGGVARRAALAREAENLVAACRRSVAWGDGAHAVPALSAAGAVLQLRGPVRLARELAEQVIALESLTGSERCRALQVRANALRMTGGSEEAGECWESALALAEAAGDEKAGRAARFGLARQHLWQGSAGPARAELERVLAEARAAADRRTEGLALGSLATLRARHADGDGALELFEAALEIHRETGDRDSEGVTLSNLGNLHASEARMDEARRCWQQALSIQRATGDRHNEGILLCSLATGHARGGEFEEAQRLLQEALRVNREVGNRRSEGTALGDLGLLLLDEGRPEEAREALEQAVAVHREVGYRYGQGFWLAGLAELARRAGEAERAVRFAEQAVAAATDHAALKADFAAALVRARVTAGDLSGAREALALVEAGPVAEERTLQACLLRGRLLLAEGDRAGAERALDEAAQLAGELRLAEGSALLDELAGLRAELSA